MPFVVAAIGAVAAAVGSAVAAAATFLGISAGLLGSVLLTGALSIGKSLLGLGKGSEPSRANLDRLRANIDPRTPRKTAVGYTAMNTDIRDEEFISNQENLCRFIVVASHKIHSIEEIWFDDKLAWSLSGGLTSDYQINGDNLAVFNMLEGNAGNVHNISSRMGTSRRYTGLAYVLLNYRLVDEESPFAQSIPTRITIRGKGALFYDPRLDSTVTGGSGAHRADDQTTWAWDDSFCRNPALALLFYLLGWRIQNPVTSEWLLAVGKGIPQERIDLESFAIAANLCDELVEDETAAMVPRYQCDGTWSEGDSPETVIEMLKATMNADLDDVDGVLRLTVFHNDLATPDADFTEVDVLDDFEWEPDIPLDQSFNIVRGVYTDASDKSLYQPVDYPQVESASPDGIDRIMTLNLPMVQRASQAQRLAQLRLARQLYGGGTFKATFQATAWRVQKNSVVRLTFPPLGFVDKLFRVAELDHRVDGTVPLLLREESPSIYDPPALLPAVDPADTTPRDYALTPWSRILPAEPGADVTSWVDGLSAISIPADHTGEVSTSLLPKTQNYKFIRNGIDLTTSAAWSVAVSSGTIAASIGAATGVLSLDESGGLLTSAVVTITAVYAGTTRTKVVTITRVDGEAPSGTGGGTTATTTLSSNIASPSFAAVSAELTVTAGAGGIVDLSAPYNYFDSGATEFIHTRWYQDMGGVYTAIGVDTQATTNSFADYYGASPGYGGNTLQVTGLTPSATYKFKLYARNAISSNTSYIFSENNAVGAVGN